MDIKAIVTDLDGTLLNEKKEISKYNKKVISKLLEKGIDVYIATGRIYKSMKRYKEELNIQNECICYNGAMIVDGKNDEIIYEVTLKEDVSKKIIDIARKRDIHLNIFQNELWYVEKENEISKMYKTTSGLDYIVKNFDEFENYNFTKVMYIAENAKLKEIENEIKNIMGDKIYSAYSRAIYFEVLNKGISKGHALSMLMEKKGIKKENILALGDAYNDVEMLETAGVSVIMENAEEELKKRFDHIAPSNEESGLGRFLNEFFKLGLEFEN